MLYFFPFFISLKFTFYCANNLGENIPVVPLSVATLIDPELSSEDADASDKAEYVHSF